jgi:23S rRNA (adenine2030-N6)-methyltransferase
MKYRHAFHAGNFADVHKHVALLQLITALQKKPKGFLYLETHAGRGRYDLSGAEQSEAQGGILALRATAKSASPGEAVPRDPALQAYLAAVTGLASDPHDYPGSPLLAAQALRVVDRAICCELQAPECRALERTLEHWPRARTQHGDGFHAVGEHLPPIERRALVLIDPPYEEHADFERSLVAIQAALQRLANATVLLWYPVKDERDLAPWLARATAALAATGAPLLDLELWRLPRDNSVALNGSGLLVVNPPWQFDEQAMQWQPELLRLLGAEARGGTSVRWLLHAH